MPRITTATESDIMLVDFFNPEASTKLLNLLREGKEIEKVESSFNDKGGDYVEFREGGNVICHIKGY